MAYCFQSACFTCRMTGRWTDHASVSIQEVRFRVVCAAAAPRQQYIWCWPLRKVAKVLGSPRASAMKLAATGCGQQQHPIANLVEAATPTKEWQSVVTLSRCWSPQICSDYFNHQGNAQSFQSAVVISREYGLDPGTLMACLRAPDRKKHKCNTCLLLWRRC